MNHCLVPLEDLFDIETVHCRANNGTSIKLTVEEELRIEQFQFLIRDLDVEIAQLEKSLLAKSSWKDRPKDYPGRVEMMIKFDMEEHILDIHKKQKALLEDCVELVRKRWYSELARKYNQYLRYCFELEVTGLSKKKKKPET